jgi:hypothetical protein
VEHLKEQLKDAPGTHNLNMLEKMKPKMVQAMDDMLLRKFSNPDYLLLTSQASYMCCWAAIAE